MKSKLFRFTTLDEEALRTIVERYGCESESQAVRLALRVLAASPMLQVQPPKPSKPARRMTEVPADHD